MEAQMPTTDDAEDRRKRADALQEKIDKIVKDSKERRARGEQEGNQEQIRDTKSETPREYVERRMREIEKEKNGED
jgi:hypothetical protein